MERHPHLTPSAALDAPPSDPADPRTFGLVKAAYSVRETLYVLSIGRTSLYAAVKRGELTSTKFRRKTLFLATDLAAFLARLGQHNGSL
jgi:excisionase family DNA binding protein